MKTKNDKPQRNSFADFLARGEVLRDNGWVLNQLTGFWQHPTLSARPYSFKSAESWNQAEGFGT